METAKIKLNQSKLQALFTLTNFYLTVNDPVGFSALLVMELMIEVHERMEAMLSNREQKKFTLRLTGAQSMAFIAFWTHIDLSLHLYESVVINSIIDHINKMNIYANIQAHNFRRH